MEIEIVQRRENPLLKRVEVTFKAIHKKEPTPTRDALRSELAKALATKDVVILDHAASVFGRFETEGYAKVYKTKELAASVERHHILVRNKLAAAEEKPAEGAPVAKPEKPAPAPKKEEPKAEPKAEKPPKAEKAPAKEEKKEERKEEKKAAEKAEKAGKPEAKKAEPKKKEGK